MGVIFVAGIHGVGKTTCCAEVAKQISIPHYTASAIIRSEKASVISEHSKEVRNVGVNQNHLVEGLRKIVEAGKQRIILDGHFTLLSAEGQIKPISVDIFAGLDVDGFVLYKDDPLRISARLQERDNMAWDVSLLTTHQNAEIAHAKVVSETLQLPIVYLEAFDSNGLVETTLRVWKTKI